MRIFAQILMAIWLLAPLAEAKIITAEPECRGFYAKFSRLVFGTTHKPEPLPFNLASLEEAIHPDKMLDGHMGMVNGGLWHYSESGKRYFVKSLGPYSGGTQQEIENAKAMARMGIGPQAHSFRDDAGVDYLIFDFVPGVNAKGIAMKASGLSPPLEVPPDVKAQIRKSLNLAADAPWPEVEKVYFAELYDRRFEAARKLKEIREKLFAEDFYRLQDFQFMIHFEKGVPGVEIQVIDSAYLQRSKPRDEHDTLTMPLDKWIRTFERWRSGAHESSADPQLKDMIEANPLPAAHH